MSNPRLHGPTLHGTAVQLAGAGLLLVGPSGSGKSDLALRLIDRGALLVADDRVLIMAEGGRAIARAPATIAGLIEVRGLGIVRLPYAPAVGLRLVLDLGRPPERLPLPDSVDIGGVGLPVLGFDASTPSAAIRAEWAMALAIANRLWWADVD